MTAVSKETSRATDGLGARLETAASPVTALQSAVCGPEPRRFTSDERQQQQLTPNNNTGEALRR